MMNTLTSIRAKSPFFVFVIAAGGCTPEFSIAAAHTGAGSVCLVLEGEWKLARFSLCISTNHSCVCEVIKYILDLDILNVSEMPNLTA